MNAFIFILSFCMKNFIVHFIRWFLFFLWVLSSVIIFGLLADSTVSLFDIIAYFIYFAWAIIGCSFMYFWYGLYEDNKQKIHLFACRGTVIPFILATAVYGYTKYNLNKDYFLHAYHPTNSHHQWKYYFREDNTLKIHGLYMMREEYNFYDFEMIGDTLFFEKILKHEGLESKKYLIQQNEDSSKNFRAFLVPLDKSYQPIDSLEKMVVPFEEN